MKITSTLKFSYFFGSYIGLSIFGIHIHLDELKLFTKLVKIYRSFTLLLEKLFC